MRWLKLAAGAVTVAPIVIALRLLSVSYAGIAAPLLLLDVVVVARVRSPTRTTSCRPPASASKIPRTGSPSSPSL
jgi:hypothetical protein